MVPVITILETLNSLNNFQFSNRSVTPHNAPWLAFSPGRKYNLPSRTSMIASELISPILKQKILSRQYARLESRSIIYDTSIHCLHLVCAIY